MQTRLRRGLVGALIVVGLAATTSAQEETPSGKKQVVVVYSYRTLMPVNADWDRGIRRGLTRGFQEPVDMNVEYLDLARNEDEQYLRNWIDLLHLKYADRQIDLLLPVYSPALEFTLAHRDTLFPDVPIVFCSANRDLADRAHNEPDVTGVAFRLDFDGTLQSARDLYPDTERVLVVCGGSDRDRGFRDAARRAFDQYDVELDIDYVEGLPLPQLREKVARVGPHTVVLVSVYDKDELGNDYTTQEVAEQLANVCPAPVFGLHDTLLGHGIVGGDLLMVEAQGELAGEMAARVLQGERPSDIPVAGLATNQLMFDARQLRRWGIREDVLPEGSIVRYREETFWERYGDYFIVGLLVLALQSVVIAALVVNRMRRRGAERALRRSRTEARQLAGKLLTAQEDERRRLAREMHDDLSQRLAATAIEAGKLEQRYADSSEPRETLHALKNALVAISDDVHQISRQIHPAILDDLGLEDALRSECNVFEERHGYAVQLRCGDLPQELPKDVALCLYRIVQEALRNVAKHAMADRARIVLNADPEFVYLEVRDSGRGFALSEVQGKPGLGLASMEERVRLVGGELTVSSEPEQGTSIAVRIPAPEEDA